MDSFSLLVPVSQTLAEWSLPSVHSFKYVKWLEVVFVFVVFYFALKVDSQNLV